MNAKTKPAAEQLPAELGQAAAIAAAADADLASATLLPGQEPEAESDKGEELAAMLMLGAKAAGKILPPLPKYFDTDACQDIAQAYMECAEKYGWTWHEKVGGPEVHLVMAVMVPTVGAIAETRAWIAWQREQAKLAATRAETGNGAPAPAQ